MSLLKLKGIHHLMIRLHTLHSTMSLLKPDPLESDPVPGDFTFHYVSIKTSSGVAPSSPSVSFTFHYVSIKTKSRLQLTAVEPFFTFHYVSIKTLLKPITCMRCMTLHSTMSLLKPRSRSGIRRHDIPLHSTMSLLKLDR